jgi:hypothetical protein
LSLAASYRIVRERQKAKRAAWQSVMEEADESRRNSSQLNNPSQNHIAQFAK